MERRVGYDRDRLASRETETSSGEPVRPVDALLRDQLVLEHLPQVKMIARRIHERLPVSVSLDDLISVGVVGLITAIDRYDAGQAVELKVYAEYKIRGAILDSLRQLDWAPRQQRRRSKQIEAAIFALEQKHRRTPTGEEIAAHLGLSISEYQDWEVRGLTLGSMESVVAEEEGCDLLRYLADSDDQWPSQIVEKAALERLLVEAIDKMPQLERTVLSLYYYEEMTLREIAKIVELHESRVSQLKSQAILRLRAYLSKGLPGSGLAEVAPTAERSASSLIENPVVQILMAAAAAFQDLETGRSWLSTPSPTLGNVAPVSLIATQAGRELVANELGLIEHGMF